MTSLSYRDILATVPVTATMVLSPIVIPSRVLAISSDTLDTRVNATETNTVNTVATKDGVQIRYKDWVHGQPIAGTATCNRCNFASLLLAGVVALAGSRGIPAARADTPRRYVAEQSYIDENNIAMRTMMTGMAIEPTGDVDRDFVAMMVPHHRGAIDMAQAELRYGHSQQLLRISQEIIAGQLQEIAAMHVALGDKVSAFEAMLAGNAPQVSAAVPSVARQLATEEAPLLHECGVAMDRMMAGTTIKPTGNIDRDFVTMMVPHHQGAIDMAQAELRHGHNVALHRVAQEIIVDETQQITLMRLAVNEALSQPAPPPTKPAPTMAAPDRGNATPMSMQMSPLASTTNRSTRP